MHTRQAPGRSRRIWLWLVAAVLAAVACLAPTPALAATSPSLQEPLAVTATLVGGEEIRGALVTFEASGLVIRDASGERRVPRDDIRRLAIQEGALGGNTGMGIGANLGVILAAISCGGCNGIGLIWGALWGMPQGAVIGSLASKIRNRTVTVYDVTEPPASSPTIGVWVRSKDGRRVSGKLLSFSPSGVVYRAEDKTNRVEWDNLERIEIPGTPTRSRVVTGSAIGALVVSLPAFLPHPSGCGPRATCPGPHFSAGAKLYLLGIGASTGAGLSVIFARGRHRVLYQAQAPTAAPTLTLTPMVVPRGTGLAATLSWR